MRVIAARRSVGQPPPPRPPPPLSPGTSCDGATLAIRVGRGARLLGSTRPLPSRWLLDSRRDVRGIRLHDITEGNPPPGSRTGRAVISSAWSFVYSNTDSHGLGDDGSASVTVVSNGPSPCLQTKMPSRCHLPGRFLTHGGHVADRKHWILHSCRAPDTFAVVGSTIITF